MQYACITCGTPSETKYCDEHSDGKGRRKHATDRYSKSFWRNRRRLLTKHPICSTSGCINPATDAHHSPSRAKLVANGLSDPDAMCWLVALCSTCHDAISHRGL